MSAITQDDTIRVLTWNVEHNGRDKDGTVHRRHHAHDVMAEYRPHLVLRQELTGADADGRRPLWEEANRLGLFAFMAPATPESPNATGVLLDPNVFEVQAEYYHVTNGWHPLCNPVVKLKGTSKLISLASVHLCSYDPPTREREARRLLFLADQQRSVLVGGDFNSYPHRAEAETVPLPDWSRVTNTGHFERRTVWRGTERVSDVEPDRILAGERVLADGQMQPGAFTEFGHHIATTFGQERGLDATASLWRADEEHRSRIDRMYATPDIAAALDHFEVVADEDVRAVSDHALLVAQFSATRLRRALTRAA
jgi:endonuclease/exonuclease/phosphatase family metal-dependent hydrolase